MLITIVLPTLLFIAGLLFMAWFNQFFCAKKPTKSSQQVHHKKEVAKKIVSTDHHDKAELKSIFATFDKNKDGFITRRELGESLANIGIHMTEEEVGEMIEKVDSNGDGLIDLDEFCELFESVISPEEEAVGGEEGGGKEEAGGRKEEDLKEAFDVFDGDKDGLITVEELGLVLSSLGLKEGKRLESCKEMIKNVDMDGDGMVNFDEFKRMMKAGANFITVS